MQESERRRALADFLRKRRERLSPTEVGLPSSTRRRTPGLRREEVAQLANMGTSWYTWLEQRRDVHPSTPVLESIAQALKLTASERRDLFLLSGQPIPLQALPDDTTQVSAQLQRMIDDLNPIPAYVLGWRWDYLAWNTAVDTVLDISELSRPYTRNLIWQLFTRQELFPHWEQLAQDILSDFRAASTCYQDHAQFDELIQHLKRVSPEFRWWWPHYDTSGSMDGHRIIEHPALGHLEFEHLSLQIPTNSHVRVMICTPLAETGAKLQQIRKVVNP
jgi:transcriptional regulator with XRE-family HTH domain